MTAPRSGPAESSDDVIWEDPPSTKNHPGTWFARLAPLMDQPKRWARVQEFPGIRQASGAAVQLRKGKLRAPPGQWEFTTRTVDDKGILYARYLGDVEP